MKTSEEFINELNSEEYMTTDEYIDHEVRLRLHEERFKINDDRFKIMESKLNWIISLIVSGMILPLFLHFVRLM
jgi:hypothetical protein